jgi:nicotinamide-nucleotide amidase
MSGSAFPPELVDEASALIEACRANRLRLVTAESCTGGLIAALVTAVPGASDVLDRGFVVYSNDSKHDMLGVGEDLIAAFGAVSAPVARAMADGALQRSAAQIAIAVTGVAGPGGGSLEKPVGLVHFACARSGGATRHVELRFGDLGRCAIRLASMRVAIQIAADACAAAVEG